MKAILILWDASINPVIGLVSDINRNCSKYSYTILIVIAVFIKIILKRCFLLISKPLGRVGGGNFYGL